MDILNSSWLVSMLEKSSPAARQRLLNLFDILNDWLDAPHIREHLSGTTANKKPDFLLQYLTEQSRASRAESPEALAHQLYFMAIGALQQELHAPGCDSLTHARQAAQALIDSQLASPAKSTRSAYGMAAGLAITAGLSSFLLLGQAPREANLVQTRAAATAPLTATSPATYVNPSYMAEMYASIEQMRSGTCHYPEAVMLPENQRSVYMRNVVGGEVSTDAVEQALATRLMQRVRCQYAPMLMKDSTG